MKRERSYISDVIYDGRDGLVRSQDRMVVGGDLNTPTCTFPELGCQFPYPPGFHTLFGHYRAGYGSSERLGSVSYKPPLDNFYGTYLKGVPVDLVTHTAFFGAHRITLDHIFANFGFPLEDPSAKICPNYSCVEGWGGVPELRSHPGGDGTDHEGLFARLGWIDPMVAASQGR